MIRALIIDDETSNRNVLKTLLDKHRPDICIAGEADNVEDAFLKIEKHKPDLIFLDIKMPQKSGFHLLKMFTEINFEVIFVTAYNSYAIRAFEFNALGYILKPINTQKLIKTVDKAVKKINSDQSNENILYFIRSLSDKNEAIAKFSVHHHGKVVFINVPDITFIEAKENNTTLNLFDNTHYYSTKDLLKYESVLNDEDHFIRINKSVILNANYIKSYSKGELCIIELKTGQSFEISRRRKAEILKKLRSTISC